MTVDDVARNRDAWNRISDDYQREHHAQLAGDEVVWGGWSIPERELVAICSLDEGATEALQRQYFGMHRIDEEWGAVGYQLPYGEWIRLLRAGGFEIEALVELRPSEDATTTYAGWVPLEWARRWPSENVWKARKRG